MTIRRHADEHSGTGVVCPGCGRRTATEEKPSRYEFLDCGLPNIWLEGGVTKTHCSRCGETYVMIDRVWQLLQVIALDLLINSSDYSGPELRFLRGACGLSQERLASMLGTRRATVAEREAKEMPGLSKMESIGVRLVFLQAFETYLSKPENCYLTRSHRRMLDAFSAEYRARLLADPKRRDKQLNFRQGRSDKDWEPARAA